MAPAKPFTLLTFGLLMGTYILVGWLSLGFAIPPGNASAVWPVAGLAVASCLIYGYRVWPAILIGATLVAGMTPIGAETAVLMGVGNTLETVIAAWLIRRYTRINAWFHDVSDVFKFVVIAAAGATLSALVGATSMLAGAHISLNAYPQTWITWLLGDFAGIVIVAPAILTSLSQSKHAGERGKLAELALFALSFGACGVLVFSFNTTPLLFLFLPFIAWLAFRFSQREVTKVNVVLAAIAIAGTLAGGGPFAVMSYSSALLLLQVFVSVVSITALSLAVTVDERRRSNQDLRKMQANLE